MAFTGFPPEAFEFYAQLEADNSKAFWQANNTTFESAVKAPMVALCDELSEHGPFHLFRPYNDLRFAKNRPPYKTAQGATSESQGGTGRYVQVSAQGVMAAAGCYMMARDQLQRFRAAVDAEGTGAEVAALVDSLAAAGYSIGAHDELKTAPRGYAKDHPRIALLRRSGLMVWSTWPVASWMYTKKAAATVRTTWDEPAGCAPGSTPTLARARCRPITGTEPPHWSP